MAADTPAPSGDGFTDAARTADAIEAQPEKPDWLSWALLVILAVIWGGSFTFTALAVRELPPITVAACRLGIAACVLFPIAYAIGGGAPSWRGETNRRIWLHAFGAAAAANAIPFSLLGWAQDGRIDSSLAAIFMAATPLIVLPLAARFVPGERLTAQKVIGFGVGFIGVALLIGVDALGGVGGDVVEILAQFACLGAATGYAIGSIIVKRAPATDPISFGALTVGLAALLAAPVALIVEQPFASPWRIEALGPVLWLGLAPTAMAMVLLMIVIRRRGPTFLGLVNYQVPVWGLIFGVAFLGETAPPQTPAALAAILGGVALSQGAHRPVIARLKALTRGASD